jgi:hypothetical protein
MDPFIFSVHVCDFSEISEIILLSGVCKNFYRIINERIEKGSIIIDWENLSKTRKLSEQFITKHKYNFRWRYIWLHGDGYSHEFQLHHLYRFIEENYAIYFEYLYNFSFTDKEKYDLKIRALKYGVYGVIGLLRISKKESTKIITTHFKSKSYI